MRLLLKCITSGKIKDLVIDMFRNDLLQFVSKLTKYPDVKKHQIKKLRAPFLKSKKLKGSIS